MKNKRGFTLLELLIAATIIGTLAVLATVSYRASESEAHVSSAKAKTEVLASAVQRFVLEYPNATLPAGLMSNAASLGACNPSSSDTNNPTTLIVCDFVGNGGWENPYFNFYVCGGTSDPCSGQSTTVTSPRACMKGTGHTRMTEQYRGSYWYCVSDTTKKDSL